MIVAAMVSAGRFAPLLRMSLLIGLALAAFLLVRGFLRAGAPVAAAEAVAGPFAPFSPSPAQATAMLDVARRILTGQESGAVPEPPGRGARLVVLSLSRAKAPAVVAEGRGGSAGEALARAAEGLSRRMSGKTEAAEIAVGRLRLDVLDRLEPPETFDDRGRVELRLGLDGLYLPGEDLALLPAEIAARELVNPRGDLQSRRLSNYLAEGNRGRGPLAGNPGKAGAPVFRTGFASFVEGGSGGAAIELYRGNVLGGTPAAEDLLAASRAGGDYLVFHQLPDGRFEYLYRSEADTVAQSYNLLRHAGSCYALFELYAATHDPRYLETGRRGVEYLLTQSRPPRPGDAGRDFETIAPPDEEAKLGGAALAMLAILEHREVTGEDRWLDRALALARFVVFLQAENGKFESKYFFDPDEAEPFESIYYPGEAILALARLHDATGDERWLRAATRGARWLIDERDAGKPTDALPHDHWLLMGLAELHPKTRDAKFLEQGRRIAEAILGAEHRGSEFPDWNGGFYDPPRSTPTATRGEALVAMHRLAKSNGLDPEPYRAAMLRFAAFQLRCQITAENSFFLPRADRAMGGFRRDLVDGEVRIDYVQHSVSALLGLREILLDAP